ncbi:MAG: ester cyclase [Myxococcota bacterium]
MTDIKQIQRRFIEEVWNKGNGAAADELVGPSAVVRSSTMTNLTGPAGVRQQVALMKSAFPDAKITIDEQVAEGDFVVARWTVTGTHTGPLMQFGATGRKISVKGSSIDRVAGGKITDTFTSWDALEMLMQIGVEPRVDMRKVVSQRLFAEVWNSGKLHVADEIIAAEATVSSQVGGTAKGPEAFKSLVKAYRDAFPDLHISIGPQVAEGDRVVTPWIARGHQRGAIMGIPATGRQISVNGMTTEKISGGKVWDTSSVIDTLDLLAQLGAVMNPK